MNSMETENDIKERLKEVEFVLGSFKKLQEYRMKLIITLEVLENVHHLEEQKILKYGKEFLS